MTNTNINSAPRKSDPMSPPSALDVVLSQQLSLRVNFASEPSTTSIAGASPTGTDAGRKLSE